LISTLFALASAATIALCSLAMTMDPKELIKEALQMAPEVRVAIAHELLNSVGDGEDDVDAEEAWAAEIQRRVEELRSGAVKGVPWSDVQRRAHEILKKARGG